MRWKRKLAAALAAASAAAAWAAPAVFVVDSPLLSLDPYDATDTRSVNICSSFYEGLFRLDEGNNVKPLLATGWAMSPDGLEYTVELRRGVQFHNGLP
ncbi:MAG: glutathione ABC transporter substrate-binding protein GsiB, partial [Duodenibacillus sp.]|nr:glutathione ABC transporter substrate-binding protein GsiB [Duodenibacillus sp.]